MLLDSELTKANHVRAFVHWSSSECRTLIRPRLVSLPTNYYAVEQVQTQISIFFGI